MRIPEELLVTGHMVVVLASDADIAVAHFLEAPVELLMKSGDLNLLSVNPLLVAVLTSAPLNLHLISNECHCVGRPLLEALTGLDGL